MAQIQHSSCICAYCFASGNTTMKLIHKRKNAENPRVTRLFGKKKKTRVSYQNFWSLFGAGDRTWSHRGVRKVEGISTFLRGSVSRGTGTSTGLPFTTAPLQILPPARTKQKRASARDRGGGLPPRLFCRGDRRRHGGTSSGGVPPPSGAELPLFAAVWRACQPHQIKRGQPKGCPLLMVRVTGLEPAHRCRHKNLNLTRLPIPPHPHVNGGAHVGHL